MKKFIERSGVFLANILALFAIFGAIPVFAEDDSWSPPACYEGQPNCVCDEYGCRLELPPPVRRTDLRHAWFGTANNTNGEGTNSGIHQIVETAPSVNVTWWQDWWCDWVSVDGNQRCTERLIKHLIEAKALGVTEAVAAVGYLVYSPPVSPNSSCYQPKSVEVMRRGLRSLFMQLKVNGVIGMVRTLYPMDEPGLYCLTDEHIRLVNTTIREVTSEFKEMEGVKLGVIHPPRSQPWVGTKYYDIIGYDNYDAGAGVLDGYREIEEEFPDKEFWLVPGPTFGDLPQPFLEWAQTHPKVWGIASFVYFERVHADEEMKRAYCEMGKTIVEPEVEFPDCLTPPPTVSLTVNGLKNVTVPVGSKLDYAWSSTRGVKFVSFWTSSNPSCSYGLLAGQWDAKEREGGYSFITEPTQSGCTYTITFAGFAGGASWATDTVTVTVQ